MLDIFHASQHFAAAAAALHDEGTEAAARPDPSRGRRAALADGPARGYWTTSGRHRRRGRRRPARRRRSTALIGYFAKHTDRLGYFGRLRSGRSIGSGAVEGLARRMGRRLRGAGPRLVYAGNLDGMAALVASVDTPEWDSLWARPMLHDYQN